MKTVNEVSRLAGVSVRTLHHYDAIGLLKPSVVTPAGYRLYDDAAVERLQSILLFRELRFSLKEIKEILDSPDYDKELALDQQISLLELQYERIGKLITFAREIKEGVVTDMTFDAFDNTKIEKYKAEAKEKWGHTRAYGEYEEKAKHKNNADMNEAGKELMDILADIGSVRDLTADDPAVQEKVGQLKKHITDNFYTCTDEILYGLGQMYVMDERFKNNIDGAGGEGTAEFVKKAIEIFCTEKGTGR